jgi:hypothetical protein
MRTLLALFVLVAALAAVVAATRARRLGARVDAMEIRPGAAAAGAPRLGDDLPFAPQRVAVIEDVRGDDAMLEDALDHVAELGGADVVVLLGDVLRQGTDAEARRLVAAVRDRGFEVMAVPGPGDLAPSVRDVCVRWLGPELWWFTRRGCVFAGVPGRGREDDDFVRSALASSAEGSHALVFTTGRVAGVDPATLFAPRSKRSSDTNVLVHVVGADRDSGGNLAWVREGRCVFTPRSAWRHLALDVLDPLVRGTGGYVAFLAACAVVAAVALANLRRRAPRVA